MSNDPLLQPYILKHLTLKNRLMTTSHEPAYTVDGMPKERYRAYHVERAKGGVALTMTAGSATVSRSSPAVFGNILAYKDEVVKWMKELADECHEYGTAVMIQLTHMGRRSRWDKADWLPILSSTHDKEPAHRTFPKKIEEWEIEGIVKDYADAAERMKAAGLDGVEIQAYGHLIDQFWSPLTNQMGSPYGGSLDNRMSFGFKVLDAVRERVGERFIVGIRFVADETLEGGLNKEDGQEIARRLKASGLVDFLNVIRGHTFTDAGLVDVVPIQGMRSAPHLDFAGEIRAATNFPTFHAARLLDVATARHAVVSGKLDMVGLTRPHLADPHIVRKIMQGREAEIRPCVGANYCLDRIYQAGAAYCIHNAATGRELTMPHDIPLAPIKRKVVVVGAGPGGLEAARVAAERGHEVIVFEADGKPGGQIRLTARSPKRREMLGIIDWRMERCLARGVSFRFNTLAEPSDVLAESPDVVIIATGGLPRVDILKSGNELVHSTWDIISGAVKPAGKVLLFDDAGDHSALQAAEFNAHAGAQLEVMTRDRTFAPEVMSMNLVPYMRSLQPHDVTFTVSFLVESVRRDGGVLVATVGSDYGGVQKERRVDQVIVNCGTLPLDDLYFALKPQSRNLGEVNYPALLDGGGPQTVNTNPEGSFQLFRVGDAVSSRNTYAAIYDALRIAKDL